MAKKVFSETVKLPGDLTPVTVDISAEPRSGLWRAEYGNNSIESANLPEVRQWVQKTVKKGVPDPVKYAPFIEIRKPYARDDYGYHGQSRQKTSFTFEFTVQLLSTEVFERAKKTRDGNEVERYRFKKPAKVGKDYTVVVDEDRWERTSESDRERSEDRLDDRDTGKLFCSLVPYTPERYQTLLGVVARIDLLRTALDDMLVQSDDPALVLDKAINFQALLEAPLKAPIPVTKKGRTP